MEVDRSRILKCIASASVGAVIGVIISEVVANSLIEISIQYVFSIIFGIAFLLLGIALTWRIWTSVRDMKQRIFLLVFALLVFASGICSFFVEENWVSLSPGAKVPMYALLGISLTFALTFSLTEFLNMSLCDRCCNTQFEENPIISTRKQIFVLFSLAIVMGACFGVLFGGMDVEDDRGSHNKFKNELLWSIPIGALFGGLMGFVNQWIRSEPINHSISSDRTAYQQI